MSTYNSKFSGAKIDELLTKIDEGKVSGSGGSEKEELAKEMGATHKHTITIAIEGEPSMKMRFVAYNRDTTQFTSETVINALGDGFYINGYIAIVKQNIMVVTDATLAMDGTSNAPSVTYIGSFRNYSFVKSVDFPNQSVETSGGCFVDNIMSMPINDLITQIGATFTDDVTEL